jgi:hypothetical protein
MKFIHSAKSTLLNIRKSFERFPITILLSVAFTAFFIYYIEIAGELYGVEEDNFIRTLMILGLGLPLSLSIGLLNENFIKNKGKIVLSYIIGGIFLIVYYLFLLQEFEMVQMTRFMGTMLFLIISVFYVLKLKRDINYESYVINIFSGAFITVLYSAVLYIGLSAIFFTIESLFDVSLLNNLYLYMFLIVVFIFGVSLFLSKLPEKDEDFIDYNYSKSLKVLLLYIVIPLITAYTIILYAYFIKILITWVWPKGLVSHLVLWYSVISVGVIFLITPLLEENKVAKMFKVYFPKFILPILAMMFVSIWQRIEQYGFTENRYYIVVLGLWVLGIMLYFSFKKPLKNIVIPISLSIVVLLSIYGPVSSYSISKMSQNNRLNRILAENGMLSNGVVTSNANVSKDVQNEVSNIISYFNNNHDLEDIRVFPDDFSVEDTKKLLGFEYTPRYGTPMDMNYFSYHLSQNKQPINISGYDYFINMSSWNNGTIFVEGDIEVKYHENHNLTVEKVGQDIIYVDINELAREIYSSSNKESRDKGSYDMEKMTFTIEKNNIELKIIFTNLFGRYNMETDNLNIENTEFMLFIK